MSTMSNTSLEVSLRDQLLSLPYSGFVQCITDLLEKLGYTQVQPAGRRDWKGRNQHGGGSGFDLTALAPPSVPSQLSQRRVVISLKQFGPEQTIYQRTLDELRGACLRVGASEALLITTGTVSPTVRQPQAAPLAPVATLDGDTLITLLIRHRVGIVEDEGCLKLDAAWFATLRQGGTGERQTRSTNTRQSCATGSVANRNATPPLRVQVLVESVFPGELPWTLNKSRGK